jgi:hypothetical protein
MEIKSIIITESLFSLTGGIGLLLWWFLMPIFLPVAESSNNFQAMILDNNWVFINVIGLVSVIFIALGFPGFYLKEFEKFNKSGFVGIVLATVGLILFACIQYYETLIWPAAAQINPELLKVNGALVSGNNHVVAGLLVSGVFLGLGYILFGISALHTKSFPKLPIWFLIIGAPVFGNGILFPIRTLGLILFSIGTIWLANYIRKVSKNILP